MAVWPLAKRHPSEPIEKIFGTINYVIDLYNLAKFGFWKIFGDWGTYEAFSKTVKQVWFSTFREKSKKRFDTFFACIYWFKKIERSVFGQMLWKVFHLSSLIFISSYLLEIIEKYDEIRQKLYLLHCFSLERRYVEVYLWSKYQFF